MLRTATNSNANATLRATALTSFSLLVLMAIEGAPETAYAAEPPALSAIPRTNADISELLKTRVDEQRMAVGMVVGVIDASGPRMVSYGVLAQDDPRPVDADTVFEIQSVTKTFTALLLADMVLRGEVRLDDPVARYLPPGSTVPERNGRQITLLDLATHMSGLPRGIPVAGADPRSPAGPGFLRRRADGPGYEAYTADDLYAFLASYSLTREPGSTFEYSDTGYALLGTALARRSGMDFAELMRTRVLVPLGMSSSAIVPTDAMKTRLAGGHDAYLRRVRYPDTRMLEGSWALRSTARDMLTYLGALLGYRDTPLKEAMAMQLEVRRPVDATVQQGLGWEVRSTPAGELVTKNGGDRGFGAYAAFDRARRIGAVVLSNRERTPNADIALHLIRGSPLASPRAPRPPGPRVEIAADPALLERYAGVYRLSQNGQSVVIRVKDGRLFGQAPGSPEIPLYPESPTEFFAKGPDVLVSFQAEPGQVPGLTLQLNGEVMTGARIGPLPPS